MFKSNCHTHTTYCDGKNSAREMVEAAIESGFESLCFTGHSPMVGGNDWTMTPEGVKAYRQEIAQLKAEYNDKIDILCGIELDRDYADVEPGDFYPVIGSVHQFCFCGKGYDIDYTFERLCQAADELFSGSFHELAECYYELLSDFVIKERVDVVGHIDLISKFNEENPRFLESDEAYRKTVFAAVDKILTAKPDIIFEVNTGAMYRLGNKKPYPDEFILKYIAKKGGRVTISSDAHCSEAIDFAFLEAEKLCKNCGINELYYFTSQTLKKYSV